MELQARVGLRAVLRALAFLVLGVALAGCVRITAIESPSAAVPTPSGAAEVHDLVILGVDFHPPVTEWTPDRPPALLVTVGNRGTVTERQINVEARLTGADGLVLAEAREVLALLVPEEDRTVQFSAPALALYRPSHRYYLHVSVTPVEGERQVTNNVRTLRIDVGAGGGRTR